MDSVLLSSSFGNFIFKIFVAPRHSSFQFHYSEPALKWTALDFWAGASTEAVTTSKVRTDQRPILDSIYWFVLTLQVYCKKKRSLNLFNFCHTLGPADSGLWHVCNFLNPLAYNMGNQTSSWVASSTKMKNLKLYDKCKCMVAHLYPS